MIRNPGDEAGRREASGVELAIEARVRECCGEAARPGADCVREVARAVEYYVAADQGAEAVDSRSLTLLTSQALASLGETGAAQRLLVFGSGLLHPSEWEIRRGQEMWVLDLRQISVPEGGGLEMALFAGLSAVLRQMSCVWDGTAGRGVIGLRNVCAAASSVAGGDGRDRDALLAAEIIGWCAGILERLRIERGWALAPEVLDLDGQ